MNYMLDINKQREQLIKVIDYLKSTGIKQKDIATNIGVDNIYLSHLRSGTIQNITSEVIEGLHDEYNINPLFITHGASNMFDIVGLKYDNFDTFVDKWDLVKHKQQSYLHFTIDENFYNFLINVYNLKEASEKSNDTQKMAEAFQKALEALKDNHPTSSVSKEYVLIPADDMLEIAQENTIRRKSLSEVVDILNFDTKQ